MGEVGSPLFSWVDGVEWVEYAVGSRDNGSWVLDSVGGCCGCHGVYEVSGDEWVIASYYEAERCVRGGEAGVDSGEWAFVGCGVGDDVHVEGYSEIGYIVVLIGSYY